MRSFYLHTPINALVKIEARGWGHLARSGKPFAGQHRQRIVDVAETGTCTKAIATCSDGKPYAVDIPEAAR